MVIGCIALGIALGGTSVAAIQALPANSVGTKQLKKNAVISVKVKDHSLLAKDFKAGQIPAGPKGDKGDKGDPGQAGAPGTALYYAHINSDGTVDAANSKGIAAGSVTNPSTGLYCISGLSPAPKNAVASVGFSGTAYDALPQLGTAFGCAAGTQISLITVDNTPARASNEFMININ